MEYRKLGKTGINVSVLGYGASPLGGVFGSIDESLGLKTVHTAIDHGVNFIDVSPYYGLTKAESVLGRALKEIPRQSYYLATKVGRYGLDQFDYSSERVTQSVEESMQRMGIDFIDLIQCHDIEFVPLKQVIHETLPALYRLKEQGKVGHIGITSLSLKALKEVYTTSTDYPVETVLSYCRYVLNDTSLESLFPDIETTGIGLINASPTGMGLLTGRSCPEWHPASKTLQSQCLKAYELCKEKGINLVDLALQFAISNPLISTCLVGTSKPKNILENIKAVEKPLDQEALQFAMKILEPIHNFNFPVGLPENQDPKIGD